MTADRIKAYKTKHECGFFEARKAIQREDAVAAIEQLRGITAVATPDYVAERVADALAAVMAWVEA